MYRGSPVSAVFWSPANRTIGKTALIEHWFSSKIAIWDFCDFKVHFFSSFSVNIIFLKVKNWLLDLFWHDHWVVYDQFLLLYIIYAIFNLDDYVLSTVVTKSKLEALHLRKNWSDLVKFLTIRCVRYCFLASKFEKFEKKKVKKRTKSKFSAVLCCL